MRSYALGAAGVLVVLSLVLFVAGCATSTPTPQERDAGAGAGTMGRMSDPNAQRAPGTPGSLEERERQLPDGRERPDLQTPAGMAEPMSREDFMSLDVHFDYNSFTLSSDAKLLLEQKAQWLAMHTDVDAQIEGHCDERGTIAYNLALGERRANAVRQYMIALGVSPSRLTTISYGEEFPLDPGHNEAAWARNRRAHFAILNQ